ncbi:MAG: hypothetical protein HY919_01725 [Elusimicrobia bacterium]|nr:hypothetical protein [Elusimicrobiota bacterium]
MKKYLLIVFCFTIFFTLRCRCEAFFTSGEILKIANNTEQSQLALSDIVKKAMGDKTTISSVPIKIEDISGQKTLTVKNIFLGKDLGEPIKAQAVKNLRVTDAPSVFCPCHHNISELRL